MLSIGLGFGLEAFFCPERIGIWVRRDGVELKIASIGIKVKKWVAYHGIAVNISTDLSKFARIIACGLAGYGQTSLRSCGLEVTAAQFDALLRHHLVLRWL